MTVVPALYLIAPLIVAGAVHAPVLRFNLLVRLAVPLDFGRMLGGRPLFGTNKTWRGVVIMSTTSTAVALAQVELYGYEPFREVSLLDYSQPNALMLGPALGLAYSLAELPNSFAKRRLGIPPGGIARRRARVQHAVDQADSAVGGTLALIPFVGFRAATLLVVFTVGFVLHVVMDRVFFLVGAKGHIAASSPLEGVRP